MKYFGLALLLLIQISSFAQSGWVRNKGGYFVQGSVSAFSSDKYYNVNGELQSSAAGTNFNTYAFKLYGEYGITNRLTGLLNLPLIKSNGLSTTENVYGVGDLRIGAKYQITKSIPFSFSVEAEIPTGKGENLATHKKANDLGIREQINLPTTDGEFNVWSTLALSSSTKSGKYYGSIFTSLNLRTEGLSHQLKSGVEIGSFWFDKLWVIGKLNFQESLSNDPEPVPFLYGEGSEFTTYAFTAIYKLNQHFDLTAEYADYAGFITSQKNIYDGASFSIGLALEY